MLLALYAMNSMLPIKSAVDVDSCTFLGLRPAALFITPHVELRALKYPFHTTYSIKFGKI